FSYECIVRERSYQIYYFAPDDTDILTLDRILSTFQFHKASERSANDNSGWKTYSNSELPFSVRYPAEWSLKEQIDSDGKLHSIKLEYSTNTPISFAVWSKDVEEVKCLKY